jgi:hypothetical protein
MTKIPQQLPVGRGSARGAESERSRGSRDASASAPARETRSAPEVVDAFSREGGPRADAVPREAGEGDSAPQRGLLGLLAGVAKRPAPLEVEAADSGNTRAVIGHHEAPTELDPGKVASLRRMARGALDRGDFLKLCWAGEAIDARALTLLADKGVGVRFRDVQGRQGEDGSFEITDDYQDIGVYALVPEEMTFLGDIQTRAADGAIDDWPVHLESHHLAHELSHAWDDVMRPDGGFRVFGGRVGAERCLSDSREVGRLFSAHKAAVAADPDRSFSGDNVRPGYECESRKEYVAEGLARLLLGQDDVLREKDPELYRFLKERYETSVSD